MPRIDPNQLLRTLSVLLSPEGGIKSIEEVNRLVQLMQKFSKKLVSKCIYIKILKASTPGLLDRFLTEKGWELLNSWFDDAITNTNWPLCFELLQLFSICPITDGMLKDNVEANQAPKLINQLKVDTRVDENLSKLAEQVLEKWMAIVQHPGGRPLVNNKMLVNAPSAEVPIQIAGGVVQGSDEKLPKSPYSKKSKVVGGDLGRKSTGSGEEEKGKTKGKINKVEKSVENVDPTDLLKGLTEELSETLKKETVVKKESSKGQEIKRPKEKRKEEVRKEELPKILEKKKEKQQKEEQEKERKQKEKDKQKEKERREKRSKPYSQTELRDDLDVDERQRIKFMAQKMKEEAESKKASSKTNMTAGLGKIPKHAKPTDGDKKPEVSVNKKDEGKKESANFSDLLGAMDKEVKKTAKVYPSKNKNRGLLESLTNTSESKPINGKLAKLEAPNKAGSLLPSKKEIQTKRDTASTSKVVERSEQKVKDVKVEDDKLKKKDDKVKDKMEKKEVSHPEKRAEKRNSSELETAPAKEKKKVAPPVIKESSMFGNCLSMKDDLMMKDDQPKKKKRRLSEVRGEKVAKEVVEAPKKDVKSKEEVGKFSFYRDTLEENGKSTNIENMDTSENEETRNNSGEANETPAADMEFQEPREKLPDEVVGILIYSKGSHRTKKKVYWAEESRLVEVQYFEMDESERCNVNKVKFEAMRQKEAEMEKSRRNESHDLAEEDGTDDPWSLTKLDAEHPLDVYGKESKEKLVQEEREKSVLRSIFFNGMKIPNDPTETHVVKTDGDADPKPVPAVDSSEHGQDSVIDYSGDGWPVSLDEGPAAGGRKPLDDILSTIQPGLIQNIIEGGEVEVPDSGNPVIDSALLAAQEAAMQTLRMSGLMPSGSTSGPNRQPQPGQDNNMFPTMHAQTGFGPDPKFGGYPPSQPDPMGNNWRGGGRGGHNNDFARGFGRGGRGGRGGFGHARGRGFGNNHRDRGQDGKRGGERRRGGGRVCKFWVEKGYCKEEDRCRFPHPNRN